MLNNLSCPIVWVLCPVAIIYAIIVGQDEVAVLVDNRVAAACRRSVVLNNISCPIVWVLCLVVIIYAIIVRQDGLRCLRIIRLRRLVAVQMC